MHIIMPLAGRGARFASAGFSCKPLVPVCGRPMLAWVLTNMAEEVSRWRAGPHTLLITVLEEHCDLIRPVVEQYAPFPWTIIPLPAVTRGAAETVLQTFDKYYAQDGRGWRALCHGELLTWNGDLLVHGGEPLPPAGSQDGAVQIIETSAPNFSFVELNADNHVIRSVEKDPISRHGTTGVYYWRYGWEFAHWARIMISENRMTRGEFYLAPVYQTMAEADCVIEVWRAETLIPLGTPEDVRHFEATCASIP